MPLFYSSIIYFFRPTPNPERDAIEDLPAFLLFLSVLLIGCHAAVAIAARVLYREVLLMYLSEAGLPSVFDMYFWLSIFLDLPLFIYFLYLFSGFQWNYFPTAKIHRWKTRILFAAVASSLLASFWICCYEILEPRYRRCGKDFHEFSCLPQKINNKLARVHCLMPEETLDKFGKKLGIGGRSLLGTSVEELTSSSVEDSSPALPSETSRKISTPQVTTASKGDTSPSRSLLTAAQVLKYQTTTPNLFYDCYFVGDDYLSFEQMDAGKTKKDPFVCSDWIYLGPSKCLCEPLPEDFREKPEVRGLGF